MSDCNGQEILRELCGHLRIDLGTFDGAVCVPCMMPYLAFVSQFVEIPDDVVFPLSIRCARRRWRSTSCSE